jgi:hypothetical protein
MTWVSYLFSAAVTAVGTHSGFLSATNETLAKADKVEEAPARLIEMS